MLLGVLGVLVLAVASVLGIPWIRLALSTVSTDDAFVNGHVTFVAPRVHGQVSRVLVDDNNRVHKGDLLVELDKEPFRDAVAVKKAAVDIAQADLQAARATVRGIEAQARSRRWNLQHAMEDVENQISLLRARVAGLEKSRASLKLAELEFERAKQLIGSATISEQEYDRRQAALTIARAQVTQSLADVYQIRVTLGLPAQPEGGDQGKRASLAPTILPAPVGHRQPRPSDLPPSVQREEQVNGPLPQGTAPKNVSEEQRIVGERGSNAVPAFDAKETCKATEVAAVFPGRNLETCINSEEATRDQLKKSWSEFPAADRAECVSASKIGGLPSYVELLTCLQMAWDVERMRATSPETTAVGGANDLHRKRHARQQQMPAPQEGKTTRVDQKGSPDQERSAGSKSNGRQETSGQSSPSNQSSGLSQRPSAPNQSDGDLGQVPPDLDQTFSSVLQAQAELIQSAAELGVVHSYNQTPKQMLEEFEKSAPQGDIDRLFARLAAQAPAVKQAEAKLAAANRDLALAELNLRYCDIVAEIDGVITRRNVNPGNDVQVGQSLMAIRSLSEIWVDANFKETQLRDLRIGQAVDLYVDMYGDRQVFNGRIAGFTEGTGSTLALLPPQNATGNFVKIVQRLPVRIELEAYDPDKVPLFIGTSVVPYVYLNKPLTGPDAGKFLQGYVRRSPATSLAASPPGVDK